MKKNSNSTFRMICLFIFCAGLFSFMVWRVIDLQWLHGGEYRKTAENNRFATQKISAARGVLLDRYDQPLVWNVQSFYKVLHPNSLLTQATPISRDAALELMASTDSASLVSETQRLYRYPKSLAHVLGYVGAVTAEDLQHDDTLTVDQHIGKAGLELQYEKILRGSDGQTVFEVNALGQKQRMIQQTLPQSGKDITTSIDPYLTELSSQALGDSFGAVVITDAQTGKVLAMTSNPSFDPNILSQTDPDPEKETERRSKVSDFFTNPDQVFFNRAISGAYPPGSIFKLVTSLAGLENGAMTATTEVIDAGKIQLGQFEFGNWYFRQYGKVEGAISLIRAIARSNDIYFYKVAEWTGPDKLSAMATLLGLGARTGIDLPAETRGLIPTPDWKQKVKNEKWFLGDTYHMGIGQGDVLTSPIQIAQLTQAIANNGTLCKMSLIADDVPECRQVDLKPEDLNAVQKGMIGACSAGGTAYPLFPYNAKKLSAVGIADGSSVISSPQTAQQLFDAGVIGCKTGTAEFGFTNARGEKKTHAWFTAIVNLPDRLSAQSTASNSGSLSDVMPAAIGGTASGSAAPVALDVLHQQWVKAMASAQDPRHHLFPRRITITALVESNDQNPFMEGSKDAAPIVKKILDWLNQ